MKTANAIKKLESLCFTNGNNHPRETQYSFTKTDMKDCIEFFDQKGEVICLGVRRKNDHSEAMTDYCATTFVDSLARALRMAA